jgi:hypothetical protein
VSIPLAGTGREELRRGDVVRVRSAAEILATLDDEGCLEGLPFMPEMVTLVGRTFTVEGRVERACDTITKNHQVRRMPSTVILDDLRCEGSGHDGCAAGCRFYWKEAWLTRAVDSSPAETPRSEAMSKLTALVERNTRSVRDGRTVYMCQATRLVAASEYVAFWDVRSFLRELTCGNVGFFRFVWVCIRVVVEELRRRLGLWPKTPVTPRGPNPSGRNVLGLEPGDHVRVRSRREIEDTLDERLKNRGLYFDREMLPRCGESHRVLRRVNHFIDESTGEMVELKSDCVILDGVVCSGDLSYGRWFCPRAIYPWWRESWLSRDGEAAPAPPAATDPAPPS